MTIVGKFKISLVGLSHDQRTNVWRVYCYCGKEFKPPTTMIAHDKIICPKCQHEEYVNYNEL